MDFKDLKIPECKKFLGYKPCLSYKNCLVNGCQADEDSNKTGTKILIISLDAMGNVLDNTPILRALKRKFPVSTIYWITMPNAEKILFNNDLIDRVFTWTDENRMILKHIEFDNVYNADKSDYACSFAMEVNAKNKYGFVLNKSGKIIPATEDAMYNYLLGNDDELKFRKNTRSGVDIIHETFGLEYKRDEYVYNFTQEEKLFIEDYKKSIGYDGKKVYIGFNTGCSYLFPNKKMTIEQHIELINRISKFDDKMIVLLGGREDTERNIQIYESLRDNAKKKVIVTPTDMGLRRGACFMKLSDVVISGDSFGMHLAIALRKYIIVWFGLSCWAEIELYDRGIKLIPEGLECSPCWKKTCPYNLECIDMIDLNKITETVKNYRK